MKTAILPFTLAVILLASPVSSQQQAPKPEIPPWNGAVFANTVTDLTMRVHTYICPPQTTIESTASGFEV